MDNADLQAALDEVAETNGLSAPTLSATNALGDAAVHYLAASNEARLLRVAVAAGADVNAAGENGNTPLHNAIHTKAVQAIETLLELGADKHRKDDFGESPVSLVRRLDKTMPKPIKKLLGVA